MSAYPDLILAHASLRAYYRMGEASGTTLDDVGPNNLDGTYASSGLTYAVAGALQNDTDTAVSSDATGSSAIATVPDNNALDLGDGPFSLEFWVKRSATQGANQVLLNKGTDAYLVRFGVANTVQFLKSGASVIASSTGAITDTTTGHQVVITKDGSAVKVYVDGADVTSAGTAQTLADTVNVLRIGHSAPTTARFPGTMDELAIYGAVLTPAQVLERYEVGRAIVHGPAAATVTPQTPTVSVAVDAPTATITAEALAPSASVTVAAPTAEVTLSASSPTVAVSVTPPAADVTVSGLAPGTSVTVTSPAADITLDGLAPTVGADRVIEAPTAEISITAFPPGVAAASAQTGGGYAPLLLLARSRRRRGHDVVMRPRSVDVRLEALAPTIEAEPSYEDELLIALALSL